MNGSRTPTRLYLNGVDEHEPNGHIDLDPSTYEPNFKSFVTDSPPRKYSRPPEKTPKLNGTVVGSKEPAAAESRPSKFVEEMEADNTATTVAGAAAASSSSPTKEAQGVPQAVAVNPATVPIRTSSRPVVDGNNGEKTTTTISPKKEPRKHRSMASVPEERDRRKYPEVEEKHWFAPSRTNHNQNRSTMSSPPRSSYSHHQQPSVATSSSQAAGDMLRGVGADLVSGISSGWSSEKENILKGPFDYLESHPGKDIRTQLITAFNAWLAVPSSSLRIISGVVTMLHTASLLIDDVEDSSQLRRGVPVANSIFGTAQTINSANYVYFCALQELLKLNNPEAIRIYTDELLNLHRGQGMDLFWRDTLTCPSEDDYLEMVGNKTGGLFRLAIKLMCAESPTHNFNPSGSPSNTQTDYIPLVNTIGLLFQILDDYRNLSDTTYTSNKGLCEDLTEGKFSFPIIHSIRSDPSNLVLINILKQKTQDEEVKRYAVAYMEKTSSFTYTRRVLRGLTKKALQLVDDVDAGRGKADGIRDVLEKLRVERHERNSKSA